MDEQDDSRLDNFLRDKLGAYRPAPTDAVWNGIEARLAGAPPPPLPPLPRRPWSSHVLPALLAGLIGVLIGWLLPHGGGVRPTIAITAPLTTTTAPVASAATAAKESPEAAGSRAEFGAGARVAPEAMTAVSAASVRPLGRRTSGVATTRTRYASTTARPRQTSGFPSASGGQGLPVAGGASAGSTAGLSIPGVLLPLVAAEAAVQATPADSVPAARTRRRVALSIEKRELARLQRRADSLLHLLSLGAEASALTAGPAALPAEDLTPPAARAVVVRREPRLTHRWQLAFTGAAERAFLTSSAPTPDSLATLRRHHEAGRTGLSAGLLAEYRLTERWSVAAGTGYARLNTELRLTEQQTAVAVQYTTTTTVNGSQTTILTTPTIAQRTTETYRVLQPSYHFLTLPLLVRYRLTPASRRTRCWADAAVGAQALLFRGGTQLVSLDGRTFREERVGAGDGPFRPVALAFTGALAVNYALTPRLAASLAPAVRWQPQSIYRPGPGLQQRLTSTGLQLGLHWTL